MPITRERPSTRRTDDAWRHARRSPAFHVVARESGGDYRSGAAERRDSPDDSDPSNSPVEQPDPVAHNDTAHDVLATLTSSIGAALAVEHDELSDPELEAAITTVQRSYDQLAMLRASLVATFQARAAARAPAERKAAAEREGARFLREELHLAPGEAKQTSEAGKQLQTNDRTRRAWQSGAVGQAHAAVIGRALRQVDERHRDSLEAELIDAAGRMDPVALGRLARRRVGEYAPEEAVRANRHRHLMRRASVRQDEHGDVIVSGAFSGTAGETIMASWRAFCDKPTRKDRRTHEQRAADAFEAMANAALRSGEAATQHGERPHVIVIVKQEDLLRGTGMAELGHTGPVPIESIGHLLRDSVMTHVGVGCDGAPIAVTTRVRSVPMGLWRALVVRDGGCTWKGCSAPVGWCDVAHGEHPYDNGGRLSPSNSALLCRQHHRRFDHGPWTIEVNGNEVVYRHSGDPPVGEAGLRSADGPGHPPADAPAGSTPDQPDADVGPRELRVSGGSGGSDPP